MDLSSIIAEERIKEAIKNGEFDNLPGKGKPLNFDDGLSGVPNELRVGYKILKNAGFVPEEIQLRKEMLSLEDLIECCKDESEKEGLKRRLDEKTLRFNMLMEKRKLKSSGAFRSYKSKIHGKLF